MKPRDDGVRPVGDGKVPFQPQRPPSVRVRISGKDTVRLLPVKEEAGNVLFAVHAVPGAHHEGVVDVHGGAIRVAVRAVPEKGEANSSLVEVLARFAGVKRGAVEIVSGHAARRKRVKIEGITAEELRRRLLAALGSVD